MTLAPWDPALPGKARGPASTLGCRSARVLRGPARVAGKWGGECSGSSGHPTGQTGEEREVSQAHADSQFQDSEPRSENKAEP